jgi:hypothetical protein
MNPDIVPIQLGDYVQATSEPHGLNNFMLCSKIDHDLESPEKTKYTIGIPFDTLTGEQSAMVQKLNAGIADQVEQVQAISQEAKDAAALAQIVNDSIQTLPAIIYDNIADEYATIVRVDDLDESVNDKIDTNKEQTDTVLEEHEAAIEEATQEALDAADAASEADQKAIDAANAASEAAQAASDAQTTANNAEDIANAAAKAAADADTLAKTAKAVADDAIVDAANAQQKADDADFNALLAQSTLEEYRTETDATISTMPDEILLAVSGTYATSDTVKTVKTDLQTQIAVGDNSVKLSFNQSVKKLNTLADEFDADVVERNTYYRFDGDAMEIGRLESDFRTVIDNTHMGFMQGATEIAAIYNNRMYNTKLEISNALTLGLAGVGFYDWILKANGNLTFKYRSA